MGASYLFFTLASEGSGGSSSRGLAGFLSLDAMLRDGQA